MHELQLPLSLLQQMIPTTTSLETAVEDVVSSRQLVGEKRRLQERTKEALGFRLGIESSVPTVMDIATADDVGAPQIQDKK